jgi:hypothetical protein
LEQTQQQKEKRLHHGGALGWIRMGLCQYI